MVALRLTNGDTTEIIGGGELDSLARDFSQIGFLESFSEKETTKSWDFFCF